MVSFVDFLKSRKHAVIDMAEAHIKDHAQNYKIDFNDYLKKFCVRHYNPRGNFFCAFEAKDALVKLLNPKPMAYSNDPNISRYQSTIIFSFLSFRSTIKWKDSLLSDTITIQDVLWK